MNKISNYSTTILFSVLAIVCLIIFVSLMISDGLGILNDTVVTFVMFGIAFIIGAILSITAYYDVAIKDNILILTSAIKEKRFVIAEVEITNIAVTLRTTFSISIVADKIYTFNYICYTAMNRKVLKELLQICKKSFAPPFK